MELVIQRVFGSFHAFVRVQIERLRGKRGVAGCEMKKEGRVLSFVTCRRQAAWYL